MSRIETASTVEPNSNRATTHQPRSTRKRSIFVLVTVLVVGIPLAFMLLVRSEGYSTADDNSGMRYLTASVATVRPVQSYTVSRSYTGLVKARRKADLGFELAGKVVTIHVDQGDHVQAEALLAELDTDILILNRAQKNSQLEAAIAYLDELRVGPRKEVIAAAEAQLRNLEAQVELGRRETERRVKLVPSGSVSQSEYDTVRLNFDSKKALLEQARARLNELKNGTRREQILAQKANVDQLSNAIKEIDLQIEKSQLLAPYTGTVSKRWIDDHVVVNKGQPLFSLVEDEALEAWIGLPANVAATLNRGDAFSITVGDRAFPARVARIVPEINLETQTRLIVFDFERPANSDRLPVVDGQVARLQIAQQIDQSGFWVPLAALQKDARGMWSCFVLSDRPAQERRQAHSFDSSALFELERRFVEVLHTEGDRSFVRGTINPDERIVDSGVHRLVIGQTVQVNKSEMSQPGFGTQNVAQVQSP